MTEQVWDRVRAFPPPDGHGVIHDWVPHWWGTRLITAHRLLSRPGSNGRSPLLLFEICMYDWSDRLRRLTFAPDHNDLLRMILFFREHDREWEDVRRAIEYVLDGVDTTFEQVKLVRRTDG